MEGSRRWAAEASRSHATGLVPIGRGADPPRAEPAWDHTLVSGVRATVGSRAPGSGTWKPPTFDDEDGEVTAPCAGACVPAGLCPPAGSDTGVEACGDAWP